MHARLRRNPVLAAMPWHTHPNRRSDCRCTNDIVWLHRDFGLRVANVFDTSEAARVLQLPNIGLAFLLNKFLGVRIDKSLRAEDWRRRPLPQAMVLTSIVIGLGVLALLAAGLKGGGHAMTAEALAAAEIAGGPMGAARAAAELLARAFLMPGEA